MKIYHWKNTAEDLDDRFTDVYITAMNFCNAEKLFLEWYETHLSKSVGMLHLLAAKDDWIIDSEEEISERVISTKFLNR